MYYYDTSIIFLIPAIIFTMIAQSKVQSAFRKYSNVRNYMGLTGAEAARRMLDQNGLRDVGIKMVAGSLTDHYDPRTKMLALSETVYGVQSIAAVSVACHEAGHALQHAHGYAPLVIRNSIVPVVNFASKLTWPLVIVGLLLLGNYNTYYIGDTIFNVAVIAFVAIVVFHLVTLPVEFNASHRAIIEMENIGIVRPEEVKSAKKVLSAAALTYVAALATAVANLIRILAIRGRRN